MFSELPCDAFIADCQARTDENQMKVRSKVRGIVSAADVMRGSAVVSTASTDAKPTSYGVC